ncbi:hypothetical protein E2C01_033098 [Portunus trituberculatus]|uniref:Peptidase A2 domain-containing protein n=1 Tax=Portunus trituberculatus TaxID=210409 RepID=A0A5B7F325_PORTR|nr:hypothetical protein [Portunus trituberculatus]
MLISVWRLGLIRGSLPVIGREAKSRDEDEGNHRPHVSVDPDVRQDYERLKGAILDAYQPSGRFTNKRRDGSGLNVVAAVSDPVNAMPEDEEAPAEEDCPVACVMQASGYGPVEPNPCLNSPITLYEPFLSMRSVKLNGSEYPVKVLRDTGASRTLLRDPNPGQYLTDRYVALTGGGSGPFSAQLVKVDLRCELHHGKAVVGVVEELRVPGIDLLLGNDLGAERET